MSIPKIIPFEKGNQILAQLYSNVEDPFAQHYPDDVQFERERYPALGDAWLVLRDMKNFARLDKLIQIIRGMYKTSTPPSFIFLQEEYTRDDKSLSLEFDMG